MPLCRNVVVFVAMLAGIVVPAFVAAVSAPTTSSTLSPQAAAPSGIISGVVVFDADGVLDENSEPIGGVAVSLFIELGGLDVGPFGITATTVSDADGTFSFNGLEDSNYQIVVQQIPDVVAVGSQPIGTLDSDIFRPGADVIIAFNPSAKQGTASLGTTLSGRVLLDDDGIIDTSSSPVAGAVLGLFAGSDTDGPDGPKVRVGETVTDETGAFTFADLEQVFYEISISGVPAELVTDRELDGGDTRGAFLPGETDIDFLYLPVSSDPPSTTEPPPTTVSAATTLPPPSVVLLPETGVTEQSWTVGLAALALVAGLAMLALSRRPATGLLDRERRL